MVATEDATLELLRLVADTTHSGEDVHEPCPVCVRRVKEIMDWLTSSPAARAVVLASTFRPI